MKITIDISTSNAAFEDDYEGEISLIMDTVSEAIHERCENCVVRDTNGNTIGSITINQE